jgi:hypothetical protein
MTAHIADLEGSLETAPDLDDLLALVSKKIDVVMSEMDRLRACLAHLEGRLDELETRSQPSYVS